MARLYADEDVPHEVAHHLRVLGHDALTTSDAGRKGADDAAQLASATADCRILITHNRRHFMRLHRLSTAHSGIIVCTRDDDNPTALAARIHAAIEAIASLDGKLIRVDRPAGN